MIIVSHGYSFYVGYDFDDDEVYLSSIKLANVDITDCIKDSISEDILEQVIERLKEENEEAKFENAIDNWDAQQ